MTRRRRKVRLVIVGVGFFAATAVLWVRLVQVQVMRHEVYRERALKQHVTLRKIPANRGTIFDRSGAPLAISARMCSIGLRPSKVRDRGRVVRELSRATGLPARQIRRRLSSTKGFSFVRRRCALPDSVAVSLARLHGVEVHHVPGRIYPGDGLAAKVVGFVNVDGKGAAGIEAALDEILRGAPGVARAVRNGSYRSEREYRQVQTLPRHGKNVYLTIDSRVQEICELELSHAVKRCGARAGAVIVMEIATGDILALAEVPAATSRASARGDSLWTVRSVAHVYEPGSTFKIVTASALLESGAVAPSDTFFAGNGRWKFAFGDIEDTHPHGTLTFEDAFAVSSNIIMARAVRRIDAESFSSYVHLFGFGQKTGSGLPAESGGFVPAVELWSGRTQQTMAFGQEIAVTAFQMLSAMAVIANDGKLMVPRIVRGVSRDDGTTDWPEPVLVRQAVSRRTASTMRTFCRRVIETGTGKNAAVPGLSVAGKTGTAQKANRHGYSRTRMTSSFVGFAPFDEPRIACLVLIDEPRYAYRYGGDSAAPVFSRVLRGMLNSTNWFDHSLRVETVAAAEFDGSPAPNLLRLRREDALERARDLGVNVLCRGDAGRVVEQIPSPGASLGEDELIRIVVAAADRSTKSHAPRGSR